MKLVSFVEVQPLLFKILLSVSEQSSYPMVSIKKGLTKRGTDCPFVNRASFLFILFSFSLDVQVLTYSVNHQSSVRLGESSIIPLRL